MTKQQNYYDDDARFKSQWVFGLKHVKNKLKKEDIKFNENDVFDFNYKEGKPVAVSKKKKKYDVNNKLQMSFYNEKMKTYKLS